MDRRARILGDIKGGLVAAPACLVFSIANGGLIFSGALPSMLVPGIETGLLTTLAASAVLALGSTFRPVVSTANSTTAAPLGAMMAAATPALLQLPAGQVVPTLGAIVVLATLFGAAALLLLGAARLGRVVRYTPFPVLAGFLSITGLLLVAGAVRLGTGIRVTLPTLPDFAQPAPLALLAATAGFTALLWAVLGRFRHPLVLPGLMVAGVLVTDAVLALAGHGPALPPTPGFFIAPPAAAPVVPPVLSLLTATPVDWPLLLSLGPAFAAYAVLLVMVTLLTSGSLETALDTDADYDREMKAQGVANLVCAAFGGFTGNPSVGVTAGSVAAGASGRLCGLVNAAAVGLFVLLGFGLLPFVPRFILAGVLAHTGLRILQTWTVLSRRRMARGEWALVPVILLVTVWYGFVAAILAGLVGACILFALDVSRTRVIRRSYGLDRRASPLTRSGEELEILSREGGRVRFVELQGQLFFGSAAQVVARVRQLVAEPGGTLLLVLDLSGVAGCDSSTLASLARMRQALGRAGVDFAVSGGPPALVAALRAAKALRPDDAVFPSRARALEAAEERLLDRQPRRGPDARAEWLDETVTDPALAAALRPFLRCEDHAPGVYLCRQGDPTDTLMFIEAGRIGVMVGTGAAATCVRVFGGRTVAGEHGFVLRQPRTASLLVEEPSRVWTLDRAVYDHLADARPEIVTALLRELFRQQSERLIFASREIAALD